MSGMYVHMHLYHVRKVGCIHFVSVCSLIPVTKYTSLKSDCFVHTPCSGLPVPVVVVSVAVRQYNYFILNTNNEILA